jgi:hypothetical protein
MSKRKDPVDQVVQFFETAPLEQAQTVLTIARGILARRTPKVKRSPSGSATSNEAAKQEARAALRKASLLDGAETVPPHVKTTRGGLAVPEDDRS